MRIAGLLIDIDGVLVTSWRPLPGAIEAIGRLRRSALPFRLMTNTTTRSRATLAETMREAGFDVSAHEILTAPVATADYLRRQHPGKACFLIAKGDVRDDFEGIELSSSDAEVVVIGGAEDRFTYQALNHAFRLIMNGAALVVMHRNLWWMTDHGPMLDAGAFVAGLERATGAEAEVTGKPARAFFEAGLSALGTDRSKTAMIGDDADSDVTGAQQAGLIGVLVRTGKGATYTGGAQEPDVVLDSIADLDDLIR